MVSTDSIWGYSCQSCYVFVFLPNLLGALGLVKSRRIILILKKQSDGREIRKKLKESCLWKATPNLVEVGSKTRVSFSTNGVSFHSTMKKMESQ